MCEVLSLLKLNSQHPVKTLRTDHTETLRSAELHRETCRLGTRKSLPLLTGSSMWRFWLAIESWVTWATPLGLEFAEGTQYSVSSLGQSFSISADFQFSSTNVSPPIAYLSVLPPSPWEGLRFLIPAAYLPASPPFWSVTLGSLLWKFGACLSSKSSAQEAFPLLPPGIKLDSLHTPSISWHWSYQTVHRWSVPEY